ncbi:MAG: SCP2 sterol-binding domain-containing protein [Bradymonadales bacterium]|nr:SCP2 sterol-binding domain-containing protein [Bradymonadales bacterium]
MSDIQTFFQETLPAKLVENAYEVEGESMTYVIKVLGDEECAWNIVVDNGAATVNQGELDSPDCLVEIFGDDLLDIVAGKLNPQMAYMAQKLRVEGSTRLALRLVNILTE